MAFQVELSAQASRDIGETFEWLKERNAVAQDKWFNVYCYLFWNGANFRISLTQKE